MTSARPSISTTEKDARQVQAEGIAAKLAELLGVDTSPEEIVRQITEAVQIKKNKQTLFRFQEEVFNGHDWSMESLRRNLTDDFIDHAAMPGDPPGLEGVQMRFSAWASAFTDAEEIESDDFVFGQGDLLAVMYDLHAQHNGEFMGIEPTHRNVIIPGMEVVRIRDDKIAEHWGIYDFLRTAEEIGAAINFVPLDNPTEQPARPVAPWTVKITAEDAGKVGDAAEKYLGKGDE
jgi:predicted SnoaL-like aldol condensation-catalyzing enzyme